MKIKAHSGEFELTFGCDPEIFVTNSRTKKLESAYGLIKGDKKNPLKVTKGAVQVDGMALEFNIDPAKNFKEFTTNIDAVMGQLKKMTPNHNFAIQAVAEFGQKYIEAQPEEAKILGCDPDFNAYTGAPNPVPDGSNGFRTASGHLHIGWKRLDDPNWPNAVDPHNPGHFEACRRLTKTLDAYLGVYSILWDTDDKRRSLYGAPGAFRPKPYGMEYRVLSNAWLDPERPHLRALVFGNAFKAIKDLFADSDICDATHMDKSAKQIIETNDKEAAKMWSLVGQYPTPKQYRLNEPEIAEYLKAA